MIFIEEKNEKIWKKIDLVVTKIDTIVNVVTKPKIEESEQKHEKINEMEMEVENDEEHKGIKNVNKECGDT